MISALSSSALFNPTPGDGKIAVRLNGEELKSSEWFLTVSFIIT